MVAVKHWLCFLELSASDVSPSEDSNRNGPTFVETPRFSPFEPLSQALATNLGTWTSCCCEAHDGAHPDVLQLIKPSNKGLSQHQGWGRGERRVSAGSLETVHSPTRERWETWMQKPRDQECIRSCCDEQH